MVCGIAWLLWLSKQNALPDTAFCDRVLNIKDVGLSSLRGWRCRLTSVSSSIWIYQIFFFFFFFYSLSVQYYCVTMLLDAYKCQSACTCICIHLWHVFLKARCDSDSGCRRIGARYYTIFQEIISECHIIFPGLFGLRLMIFTYNT